MKVPLLDLVRQYQCIKDEVQAAIMPVIEKQQFIMGPQVKTCEAAVAAYSGCRFGVGTSSGTDAILLSLMTEGIGAGDEVITTPYTFFATGGCIARVGAKPVFVDIDPVTFNIRADLVEAAVTEKTRAIVPVHLFGQCAEMDPILDVAARHRLVVIEDAAQAIGAEYKGRRAGSIAHYGCFSFFPSKNLGAFGDGGMVVTNSPEKAERLAIFRNHGAKPKYYHKSIGGNFRLDTLQAAVIEVKLRHLDAWTEGRQANAARYERLFAAAGLVEKGAAILPRITQNRHIFNQYVIRAKERDRLQAFLKEREIGSEVYYPVSLHRQECFQYLGCREGDFPESEKAARETLALPVFPELRDEEAEYVVRTISEFHRG
jgi:dTDP-4-amino-4,6-dideoxygalactose transaminase